MEPNFHVGQASYSAAVAEVVAAAAAEDVAAGAAVLGLRQAASDRPTVQGAPFYPGVQRRTAGFAAPRREPRRYFRPQPLTKRAPLYWGSFLGPQTKYSENTNVILNVVLCYINKFSLTSHQK